MPLKSSWVSGELFSAADQNDVADAVNALALNFSDYGVCDGTTNDAAAFTTVLAALSTAGGGTLLLPPKTIAMTVTSTGFSVPANTRIVGYPGATKILLTSDTTGATDRVFVKTVGNNVTFDGVNLTRNADFSLVFLLPGAYSGFHVRNCVLDGKQNTYPTNYVHGIDLDTAGTKSNITVKGSTITRLNYGLFQSNAVTATADTIVVDDCTFAANSADDLCFNAPNSTMKNVSVVNSHFSGNVSTVASAGFGVDFAHVIGGTVHNCSFEGYSYEAVHIEDYSTNVHVTANTVVSCGTVDGAAILAITGSSDVVISGNTVDARANTNVKYGVAVLAGATGTTPGGRDATAAPTRVTITDNVIRCGATYRGMYIENVSDIVIQGNQVFGAGTVTAGVWNDGNPDSGIVIDGHETIVDANVIRGFRYAISGPANTRATLGDPGAVKGNVITDCYVGIWAGSPGTLTISGNTMSNCVRPLIVGEAGATAKICSVVNNSAFGCVYRMEIGGKLILIRDGSWGAATVGSARTIDTRNNLLKIPAGTVITYAPSGGVLTVTTAVTTARTDSTFAWTLVGNVTVATIATTDVGTASGLAHSTTSANNHVMTANNLDTVAGVYT